MCVIIDRKAGADIPLEKIEIACDINKHGFGLVYLDKGHLHVIRSLENNDPKEVFKLLEEHKKRRVWLHLRHATVGSVSKENSHPMVVATKKEDGVDVLMMHNGTLHDYTSKDATDTLSDTYYYNQTFVQPLFKRCQPFGGLQDKFFIKQFGKSLGYTQSVVLFVDSTGFVLRGNGDKGKEFDWGWASNDYSFDNQHIRSSNRNTVGFTNYDYYGSDDKPKWNDRKRRRAERRVKNSHFTEAWKELANGEDRNGLNDPVVYDACLKLDMKKIVEALKKAWKVTEKSIEHEVKDAASMVPVPRKTFIELAGITSIDDMSRLSREDFINLCDNHPNGMAELFIDLMSENRRLKTMKIVQENSVKG